MSLQGPGITYPYLPERKKLKYVAYDHPFMLEAKKVREELAGDPVYPVGAVAVRDGHVLVRAGNGYNLGSHHMHICPRIVHECPSGQGYDVCRFHIPEGHAEQMLVNIAQEQGIDLTDADVYLYGHWWACESCWNRCLKAGIRDIYVAVDAHERFSRDIVHKMVCTPSIRSVYITGAHTTFLQKDRYEYLRLYERLGEVVRGLGLEGCVGCQEVDCEIVHSQQNIADHDIVVAEVTYPSHHVGIELAIAQKKKKNIVFLSKQGSEVDGFVKNLPGIVYHAEYQNADEACKFLKNILKQL